MGYELAKKLKDSGFPQAYPTGNGCGFFYKNDDGSNECYAPTLTELIEACGDRFYSLHQDDPISGIYRFGKFYATAKPQIAERFGGDTPEEAVANLWLALNKK